MSVVRTVAALLFLAFMGLFALGVRDWAGAAFAFGLFLLVAATCREPRKPRAVSPHYDEGPTRLDRLEADGPTKFLEDEHRARS